MTLSVCSYDLLRGFLITSWAWYSSGIPSNHLTKLLKEKVASSSVNTIITLLNPAPQRFRVAKKLESSVCRVLIGGGLA